MASSPLITSSQRHNNKNDIQSHTEQERDRERVDLCKHVLKCVSCHRQPSTRARARARAFNEIEL